MNKITGRFYISDSSQNTRHKPQNKISNLPGLLKIACEEDGSRDTYKLNSRLNIGLFNDMISTTLTTTHYFALCGAGE